MSTRHLHRAIMALVALILTSLPCRAQEFPGDVTYYALVQKIKEVKRSSLSVEWMRIADDIKTVNPTLLGSGFLALISGDYYAVTNFHVIKNLRKDGRLLVGLNLKQGKVYNLAAITRTDTVKDIAVLALSDSFLSKSPIDTSLFHLNQAAIGVTMFADTTEYQEGQGVLVVGFPLGLGSEVAGNEPISRIGMIAQSRRSSGTFLLDGISSHGNSGSPVFNLKTLKLVGMIVGFPSDYIVAFDENGQVVAQLPYNSGLSVCISSRDILRLISR